MTDNAELATELESAALQVAGVQQLYLAGSSVKAVLAEGARALGVGSGANAVAVNIGDESCTIQVSCAVSADHRAGDVVREVARTLADLCRDKGLPPARMEVTVAAVTAVDATAPPGS